MCQIYLITMVFLYSIFILGHPKLLLVKIAFDGNNKIKPQCVMVEEDCSRIANDAHIHFDSAVDIFYNRQSEFDENESNEEAANQLKLFCPKPLVQKAQQTREVPMGVNWNCNLQEQAKKNSEGSTIFTYILYIFHKWTHQSFNLVKQIYVVHYDTFLEI